MQNSWFLFKKVPTTQMNFSNQNRKSHKYCEKTLFSRGLPNTYEHKWGSGTITCEYKDLLF